jgi:hypothetical protein
VEFASAFREQVLKSAADGHFMVNMELAELAELAVRQTHKRLPIGGFVTVVEAEALAEDR